MIADLSDFEVDLGGDAPITVQAYVQANEDERGWFWDVDLFPMRGKLSDADYASAYDQIKKQLGSVSRRVQDQAMREFYRYG